MTFQIAYFDDFVCFFKKVTFQIASKFYTNLRARRMNDKITYKRRVCVMCNIVVIVVIMMRSSIGV